MTEFATLQHATYTEAEWTAWDGVLLAGQVGYSSDALYSGTNQMKVKIGNGTDTWTDLDYVPEPTGFTGGNLTSALNEAKGADIASAATTDIGAATGNFVHVTGTTTITALGTVQAGTRRIVRFAGALTLTHNATSLILPTGANITTAANDVATFVSEGSGNWRCVNYTRADGSSLSGGVTVSSIGSAINGATDATPNDTDLLMSVESSVAKKNTWTQIKAFLKTYFDTIYTTTSAVATQITTAISGKEDTSNKSSSYTLSSTTTYANTKALVDGLATKVNTSDASVTNNRGRKYFAYDNTTYTYTGTTAQTILKTIHIPAGSLTANSTLELYVNFVASGVLNAKTGGIYITTNQSAISGGTVIYTLQVGGTILSWSKNLRLTNKNSLNSQLLFLTSTQPYYSSNSTSAKTATSFDFSVDQYIHIYSSMLNSGDTVGISDYQCYIDKE